MIDRKGTINNTEWFEQELLEIVKHRTRAKLIREQLQADHYKWSLVSDMYETIEKGEWETARHMVKLCWELKIISETMHKEIMEYLRHKIRQRN